MAGSKFNALENRVLKYLYTTDAVPARPTSWALHLYTVGPNEDGTGTEAAYTDYAAVASTWTVPNAGGANDDRATLAARVDFQTPDVNTDLTGFAIKDQNGNFLHGQIFDAPIRANAGQPLFFEAGGITIVEA